MRINTNIKQPEDIHTIYERLSAISPNFSIAAGFGNVHGTTPVKLKRLLRLMMTSV